MSTGIKDKVAIIGMGCTRFGEWWDKSPTDLIVEAAYEAYESAGIDPKQIEACWLGTLSSGNAGLFLSEPLKLDYVPVTRVENFCASGSEAFRGACYAVASGACNMAMALGVEKLKDSGYSGLTGTAIGDTDGSEPSITAPGSFALLAPAYFHKYGVDPETGKEVLSRIAMKNHANGAKNIRAQYRKAVTLEACMKSPAVASPLGIMDCSGVSDGAAAAIIVRAEDAYKYTKNPIFVKALAVAAGPGTGQFDPEYDFTTVMENTHAAAKAYAEAGISDPENQINMAEVHDCFTPTELVIYEDLGFSKRGEAWKDVLAGKFELTGKLPVNPDGGLKSFGHPIGASGLRMIFELWLQFRGEAGERQIKGPKLGLTHNLGGRPWKCVAFIGVFGKEQG